MAKSKKSAKAKTKTKKLRRPKLVAKKKAQKAKKPKVQKVSNRRKHRRHPTTNLWVTERQGDFQFVAAASDISEGGIFLQGRLKTTRAPSQLSVHLGNSLGTLDIEAQAVYDRLNKNGYGTGYRFTQLTSTQIKALKSFLRDLN